MTHYSAHKKLTTVPWYSPPFYTFQEIYKMCIRVDANGWGDGAGTHVSVHVFFMEGNCRVQLDRTNFYFYVTIQLVNHSNEQDQYEKTLCFVGGDPKYRKTHGDMTKLGCGIPQFIAHDDIESSTDTKLYIINDCLTWRVVKACERIHRK